MIEVLSDIMKPVSSFLEASVLAISKIGNGEWRNGEWGTGNGESLK